MNIYEKLLAIQQEVKAPKDKTNDFGKYKYRSAEQILESVKPHLKKHKATLVINDEIVAIEGRLFVKATATLIDIEETQVGNLNIFKEISSTAFAELSEHKGMTADQTTGTASSYARKYALNALFLLDDTKDADSNEFKREKDSKADLVLHLSQEQLGKILTELKRTGKDESIVCERFGVNTLEELTSEQAESALRGLKATGGNK